MLSGTKEEYPLHSACRRGDVSILKLLLKNGYSPNQQDFDLIQPLHEACSWDKTDCVQLLLEAGADVNSRNIDSATPLCDACSVGNAECVKLLLANGAEVNPSLLLTSPLHEAALRDNWECCQLLVDAGASLDHTDCHFGTPLHAATWKNRAKTAFVLLKAGCNVNATKVLSTALHYAAAQDDFAMIELLLQFGANVYAVNNHGKKVSDLLQLTSPANNFVLDWEANPRDLKHICRLAIRRHIQPERLHHLPKLGLPSLLQKYLTYQDVDI